MLGKEVGPVDDIAVLADLCKKLLGVGADKGGFPLHGEQHMPGLYYDSPGLGQGEVGRRGHLHGLQHCKLTVGDDGEGKVLEDVASVLPKRMEGGLTDPQVLAEVGCEFLLKLQLVLDYGHHVVVLLDPQQHFRYSPQLLLVRPHLE